MLHLFFMIVCTQTFALKSLQSFLSSKHSKLLHFVNQLFYTTKPYTSKPTFNNHSSSASLLLVLVLIW